MFADFLGQRTYSIYLPVICSPPHLILAAVDTPHHPPVTGHHVDARDLLHGHLTVQYYEIIILLIVY